MFPHVSVFWERTELEISEAIPVKYSVLSPSIRDLLFMKRIPYP